VEGVDRLGNVEVLRDGLTVGDDGELAPADVLGPFVQTLLAERAEDGA